MCSINPRASDHFYETLKIMTDDLLRDLFVKWGKMYEFNDEMKETRMQKLLSYVKNFYDEIASVEQQKMEVLLDNIESKLKEFHQLKKDLHDQGEEDVRQMHVKEPYRTFFEEIERKMLDSLEIKNKRLQTLQQFCKLENELCICLGVPMSPEIPDPIPTENQLDHLEQRIFELREKKITHMHIYNDLKEQIIHLSNELEYKPVLEFEKQLISDSVDSFKPTGQNIKRLQEFHKSLVEDRDRANANRQDSIDKLVQLWNLIKVKQEDRNIFLSQWPSIGQSHIAALKREITRCEAIKLASIKPVIESLREDITNIWNKLTYTPEERQAFTPFQTDLYSEDVLALHELELERLNHFYATHVRIFDLAVKRDELWNRMIQLDDIGQNKGRLFNNRGGQLLKEERERKTLEVNLPKVNEQLKTALSEFLASEGKPFLWHGVNLLEMITEQWDERMLSKEAKKLVRKVENQKIILSEARLGAKPVAKRKIATPVSASRAKARKYDDSDRTIIIREGFRTPSKMPVVIIRTPSNVSSSSIASYSHFQQDGIEKSITRSALREVGNTPGIAHSSPTLMTPAGRRGTPKAVSSMRTMSSAKRTPGTSTRGTPRTQIPRTVPRLTRPRTRLPIDI